MPNKSNDPKERRITVRVSERDLSDLQLGAARESCTVGEMVRRLIRDKLAGEAPSQSTAAPLPAEPEPGA
jgi:hypothetical protein